MSDWIGGKAVVVGGRGFLGQHVVSALVARGVDVVSTVRGGDIHGTVSLDLLSTPARTIQRMLASIMPDTVINCSGVTQGPPEALADGNILAPARLLDALAVAAPSARFVHLGSAAEYGAVGGVGQPVDEETAAQPVAPYGVTKLAGTRVVLGLADDRGVDAVVLRVFNPVGPGCPEATLPGRTARLLRTIAPGMPLQLAPLDSFRDFVDVRDIAAAVAACVRAEKLPGRLYNVASGQATLTRTLVHHLIHISGFAGEVHEQSQASDRSLAVSWQRANIDRACTELEWWPRFDLEDSLTDLWRSSS